MDLLVSAWNVASGLLPLLMRSLPEAVPPLNWGLGADVKVAVPLRPGKSLLRLERLRCQRF